MERLTRRREQLGPVNPLAQEEYAEAVAHVEELERQRTDLETALRELRAVIRETDRQIEETFEETFAGGGAQLRGARRRRVPGRQRAAAARRAKSRRRARCSAASRCRRARRDDGRCGRGGRGGGGRGGAATAQEEQLPGVEIEITPAGKSTKRLSLLSGGEKSMTALAFLFAVFLARPCPFYILDEVEAALDDLNLDRFLALLRRYADRAQFIVITHQKRTMEAADCLYGVSMGADGVSKVISRRLPPEHQAQDADGETAEVAGSRVGRTERYRRAPVARDWSDLFITGEAGEPQAGASGRGGGRAGRERGGLFKRLRESMAKTRQALGCEIQATLFGDARRADLGTPGGGADHGRRGREHDCVGRGRRSRRRRPRGSSRAARR